MLARGSQPEPSAKAPCTKTTFLICCVMTSLLGSKDPASHLHPKRAFVVNESPVECPMPAVALAANLSVIDGPSRYPQRSSRHQQEGALSTRARCAGPIALCPASCASGYLCGDLG